MEIDVVGQAFNPGVRCHPGGDGIRQSATRVTALRKTFLVLTPPIRMVKTILLATGEFRPTINKMLLFTFVR